MNKKMQKFVDKKLEDSSHCSEVPLMMVRMPMTVLLGPNGTGKTTSIRSQIAKLEDLDINYLYYSTSKDSASKHAIGLSGVNEALLASMFFSEGERMTTQIDEWLCAHISKDLIDSDEPLYMYFDELDSGLSLDRIIEQASMLRMIYETLSSSGRKLHFVVTCNSHELLSVLDVYFHTMIDYIWVPTKQYRSYMSYKAFKKLYTSYYSAMHEELHHEKV